MFNIFHMHGCIFMSRISYNDDLKLYKKKIDMSCCKVCMHCDLVNSFTWQIHVNYKIISDRLTPNGISMNYHFTYYLQVSSIICTDSKKSGTFRLSEVTTQLKYLEHFRLPEKLFDVFSDLYHRSPCKVAIRGNKVQTPH